MTFVEWQKKVNDLWANTATGEAAILAVELEIAKETELSVYEKGYLLACFINHPAVLTNSKAEEVAMLGGTFENEKLMPAAKATGCLAEVVSLLE
jgi:hypothetical protein